jgi:hypothetical protein
MVTILGREYTVPPRVVEALTLKRPWYNAGVVGPDAYPDLMMGQAVIHPEDTGEWLNRVLDMAWAAQGSADYTNDEQLEILAFAYGFLTHAAGDMWAHTLVNDFAGGIFPTVGEMATDPAKAAIAVRHVIVEGLVGDATPGFDGNHERGPAPGLNEDGDPDVSDDSTHGIAYEAPPDKFIYDVFIARGVDAAGHYTQPVGNQPTAARGPVVDFFYGLRNLWSDFAGSNSNVQQVVDDFNALQGDIAEVNAECSFPPDVIECPIALAKLGFDSIEAFFAGVGDLVEAALEEIVDAYLRAWIEDIDNGLQHWGQVGEAFNKGLFDPQARRDAQNEECGEVGFGEGDQARANCEDGVGIFDSFLAQLAPLATTSDPHLLSMAGAPDFVGAGIEIRNELRDFIDGLIDFPNPLETAQAELEEFLKEKINDALTDVLGFDPEKFAEMLKNPSSYMDPIHSPLNLPPPLDVLDEVGGLFGAGDHERLDSYIGFDDPGLTAQHHDLETRRLLDDAELVLEDFDALENTVTTAKLLLLDGPELNRALGDILGRDVGTYGPGENLMVDGMVAGEPWLQSIDSDHAWRVNGAPRFPDRPVEENGGNGTFPLFESCALRPSFRALFDDWENDGNPAGDDFPDLGDAPSADTANDPNAPTPSLTQTAGESFQQPNGSYFVGPGSAFTIGAEDTPAAKSFPQDQLSVRYAVFQGDPQPRPWVNAAIGDTVTIPEGDGQWIVEVEAADPCHPFDGSLGSPGSSHNEVILDTTPPVVTGHTPPFGLTYDSDDLATVDYTVDDGPNGSGVASQSAIIDGWDGDPDVANTTRPTFDGDLLDMYLFYPGPRTVSVTATDNVGNSATTPLTFELHATAASLLSNLDRARDEGRLADPPGVYNSLHAKLTNAKKKHDAGQHAVEWNVLGAWVNELEAQREHHVAVRIADRFIAYAEDLVTGGG